MLNKNCDAIPSHTQKYKVAKSQILHLVMFIKMVVSTLAYTGEMKTFKVNLNEKILHTYIFLI